MKIKAVEIARALGISKSTVSLALNGKPGVSERTRQEVMAYKEILEKGGALPSAISEEQESTPVANAGGRQIKVLLISNGLKNVQGAEMDLWTDVNSVLEHHARTYGASLSVMYLDYRRKEDLAQMVAECNADSVIGVVVLGTELHPGEGQELHGIRKPMVIYDSDLDDPLYPCVMVNNRQGIELAVDSLISNGRGDILYLGNALEMYNYQSRRRGFAEACQKHSIPQPADRIILAGTGVEEVYRFMKNWLEGHPLPEAFVMDSYHISIGTIRALREAGVRIPQDVALIGVDVLPSYLTGDMEMTAVRIPHTERANWVAQFLFKEIENPVSVKSRLYMNCELVAGNTV